MKQTMILTMAFLIMLCPVLAPAEEWWISARPMLVVPVDDELQSGQGIQGEFGWKYFYGYLSYQENERRISGQRAGNNRIFGGGLGVKVPINPNIKIWGQVGYYRPDSDLEDASPGPNWKSETLWLYWKNWGVAHNYNVSGYYWYKYRISGNVGGALGFDLSYPLFENWEVGLSGAYNLMKFREQFYAYDGMVGGRSYLETREEKDFSSVNLGLQLAWKF